MTNPILAGTDFSDNARRAAERAALIARSRGADLELLHVESASALRDLSELLGAEAKDVARRVEEQVRGSLEALGTELASRYGITVRTSLRRGEAAGELAAAAESIDASLVVLGARGASPFRDALLGTTTLRALSRSRRPVLAVRRPVAADYRRILVALDVSAASLPLLRLVSEAAPGAELTLLHAFELPFEGKLRFAGVRESTVKYYVEAGRERALARLDKLVAKAGVHGAKEIVHGLAQRAILERAVALDADLVALGRHAKAVLRDLVLGTVSRHVLSDAPCDVLVGGEPPA